MSASRAKAGAKAVQDVLGELVQELGIGPTLRAYDAVLLWEDVVGSHIAKVAVAEKISRGILTVRVSNSTWRYELTLRKKELIDKLNAALNEEIVKDIRFR